MTDTDYAALWDAQEVVDRIHGYDPDVTATLRAAFDALLAEHEAFEGANIDGLDGVGDLNPWPAHDHATRVLAGHLGTSRGKQTAPQQVRHHDA